MLFIINFLDLIYFSNLKSYIIAALVNLITVVSLLGLSIAVFSAAIVAARDTLDAIILTRNSSIHF